MVMRFKFFMLLITFVMLTACGGSDDSSSDEIIPEIPSINISGKKTAIRINVVAIIANVICFDPL